LQIYKGLILPKLDYASFLFGHIAQSELNKLETVQNQALRISLGSCKSTPTQALHTEASILPLNERRRMLSDRLVYKIITDSKHPAYNSLTFLNFLTLHLKYWEKKNKPLFIASFQTIEKLNPNHINCKDVNKEWDMERPILMENVPICDANISDNVISKKYSNTYIITQSFLQKVNITYKDHLIVYTDGSKTDEGSGAAFWIPEMDVAHKYKLHYTYSSYSAELYAIYRAILYIQPLNREQFLICSDSMSAIKAIESASKARPCTDLVLKIFQETLPIASKIKFQWCPGHSGIAGNDKVDLLAKEAVRDGEITTDIHTQTDDFKSARKKYYKKQFQDKFLGSGKAKWYKDLQKSVPPFPWFKNSKLNRREIITICRLKFGHAIVNQYLHKFHMFFTPLCLNCTLGLEESIEHLLFICPHFDYQRKQILKISKHKYNYNTISILGSNDTDVYKEINQYLLRIERKI